MEEDGSAVGGGASGAGSINIFFNESITKGMISTIGGIGGLSEGFQGFAGIRGGSGGNGCVSIGNISTGTYQEYIENIE